MLSFLGARPGVNLNRLEVGHRLLELFVMRFFINSIIKLPGVEMLLAHVAAITGGGGRGVASAEGFIVLEELAGLLGGHESKYKPICYHGWCCGELPGHVTVCPAEHF